MDTLNHSESYLKADPIKGIGTVDWIKWDKTVNEYLTNENTYDRAMTFLDSFSKHVGAYALSMGDAFSGYTSSDLESEARDRAEATPKRIKPKSKLTGTLTLKSIK